MKTLFVLCFSVIFFFSPGFLHCATSHSEAILIVGGAGFIGSHVNEMLYRQGYQTIIFDNLSTGSRETVKHGIFIEGDLADVKRPRSTLLSYRIDAVMHFAALKNVGESVTQPSSYYENNVCYTLNLLNAMKKHQVNKIIFSSSAAIFGNPIAIPLSEDHPCHPINPYGQTKLIVEHLLADFDRAYGIRYSCLRYFNAAGGDPEGKIKYRQKDSNLIPVVLRSLQNPEIT